LAAVKSKQKTKPRGKSRHQYAAIPVRFTGQGKMQVLLLTSRGSRRWVIPKGWPMRQLSPGATAAREAYEEAGLEGAIVSDTPVGWYIYDKDLGGGAHARVEVGVFLLRVSRQLDDWPEQAERETQWFDPEQAADLVSERGLATILRSVRSLWPHAE
jgi:8-oxo-dGTP pyrophosphatase MutT (NUDIX family)